MAKKNRTYVVYLMVSDDCYQNAFVKANGIIENSDYITFLDFDNHVTGKFKKDVVLGYATRDLEDWLWMIFHLKLI